MNSQQEVKKCLSHSSRALESVAQLRTHFSEDGKLQDMCHHLQKLRREMMDQRESMLLQIVTKGKESPDRYRWSWWAFPVPEKVDSPPRQLTSASEKLYEHQIEALNDACKDPCARRRRINKEEGYFLVCLIAPDTPCPGAVPYRLYHCMTPYTNDGALPMVGKEVHPAHYGDELASEDAVYKAHAEYATFDKWDGPSGLEFIGLAPSGLSYDERKVLS